MASGELEAVRQRIRDTFGSWGADKPLEELFRWRLETKFER